MGDGAEGWKGWCCGVLVVFSLFGPCVRAEAGQERAASLCEKADRAERDAKDAERKSEERLRFLQGKGGTASQNVAFPSANATALTQSLRAQVAQARAALPQIRQGVAAANQDRGVVPGLSQYFRQMDSSISSALQAVEACLDAPARCSAPPIFCSPPPNLPVFHENVQSADFIRQVQVSYRQAAASAYQACRNLQAAATRDMGRLLRESRGAGTGSGPSAASVQPFGQTDLYLRRAANLRRDASEFRMEADRLSGVRGYCGVRNSSSRADATHAAFDALKATEGRERDPGAVFPLDGKVIDLKAAWEAKWGKGPALKASDVPLPKLAVGDDGGETAGSRAMEYVKDSIDRDGPEWWRNLKASYREADRQMGLTDFILSRPKELAKDIVTEFVNENCPFGKTITEGYKIVSAVKTTGDEVGGILVDAPAVIVHGSEAEAKALAGRTDRVPLNLMNNLFDGVTGKFPMPKYGQNGPAHE